MQKLIPEEMYPLLSDYAKVLIPASITYLVTRYSLSRPRKYEVRQKQFDLVYLPLYLLTKQYLQDYKSEGNLKQYIKKVERIFYKNYQFVFPKTEKVFNKFKTQLQSSNDINLYNLANLESQVNSDYEKLKRELGYPTNSIIDFLRRLSPFNKVMYFVVLFLLLFTIYCFVEFFLLLISGNPFNSISSLFAALLMVFLLYIIISIINH